MGAIPSQIEASPEIDGCRVGMRLLHGQRMLMQYVRLLGSTPGRMSLAPARRGADEIWSPGRAGRLLLAVLQAEVG